MSSSLQINGKCMCVFMPLPTKAFCFVVVQTAIRLLTRISRDAIAISLYLVDVVQ